MSTFDCAAVDEHAAEHALGLLDGEERAAVLAHLEVCPRCRSAVGALADAADATLTVAPEAEPPAGFEERVLAATGAARAGSKASRSRRVASIAAAIVLALALAAGGYSLGRVHRGAESADVRGRSGQTVGRVVVTADEPAWMFLSLEGGSVKGAYSCELALKDGTVVPLGEFDSQDGRAGWAGPVPVPRNDIREMRVLLPDGRVVATAVLS